MGSELNWLIIGRWMAWSTRELGNISWSTYGTENWLDRCEIVLVTPAGRGIVMNVKGRDFWLLYEGWLLWYIGAWLPWLMFIGGIILVYVLGWDCLGSYWGGIVLVYILGRNFIVISWWGHDHAGSWMGAWHFQLMKGVRIVLVNLYGRDCLLRREGTCCKTCWIKHSSKCYCALTARRRMAICKGAGWSTTMDEGRVASLMYSGMIA